MTHPTPPQSTSTTPVSSPFLRPGSSPSDSERPWTSSASREPSEVLGFHKSVFPPFVLLGPNSFRESPDWDVEGRRHVEGRDVVLLTKPVLAIGEGVATLLKDRDRSGGRSSFPSHGRRRREGSSSTGESCASALVESVRISDVPVVSTVRRGEESLRASEGGSQRKRPRTPSRQRRKLQETPPLYDEVSPTRTRTGRCHRRTSGSPPPPSFISLF